MYDGAHLFEMLVMSKFVMHKGSISKRLQEHSKKKDPRWSGKDMQNMTQYAANINNTTTAIKAAELTVTCQRRPMEAAKYLYTALMDLPVSFCRLNCVQHALQE